VRDTSFSDEHEFAKPNDVRALQLMDHAATDLMEQYPDIVLAFGESDEFRSLMPRLDLARLMFPSILPYLVS
jgi:tRNA(His) 5'-end guanylyltransferase